MRAYDIIAKKRNGDKLSKEEIYFFINGYTKGNIPDYQASALCMAIYFQGLDAEETAHLTMAMVESGDQIDLSAISGVKADKHSTGGVGDTTTIVLGPWAAAAGAPMAKMSGRGLGHTGGTLDKLEAIPGFEIEIGSDRFVQSVNDIGVAVVGQTGNLVPADKMLYALRDVTATVESMPLIASSIMSKKIASGADAIVLDVKAGDGAFMKTVDDAFALARSLVSIGEMVGRKTVAVITGMDQPLGYAIGNTLEVEEAIAALKGEGPEDLHQLCVVLGGHILHLSGITESAAAGEKRMLEVLESGQALEKLKQMINNQHGDSSIIEQPNKLPHAKHEKVVVAQTAGFVARFEAEKTGIAAMIMGAGRETKDDTIDYGAGIVLHKKAGDAVQIGDQLATLYSDREETMQQAEAMLLSAYHMSDQLVDVPPLIYGIVTAQEEKRF